MMRDNRIDTPYRSALTRLLLAGLLLASSGAGAYQLNNHTIDLQQPPGRLVDIGGYRLHIYCVGEGTPTVLFDSGIGGFSLEWTSVQTALSRESRVCTYDRAGYGWSDRSPYQRSTRIIANELHRLLQAAEVPGPYLLVGHSFGGYNIRYFASEHPQEVAGLVLIDASHPEQFDYFPKLQHDGDSTAGSRPGTRIVRPVYPAAYPAGVRQLAYMLMVRRRSAWIQLAELESFRESADQLLALGDDLPEDVPVTVITRGSRVWPDNNYGDAMERVWSFLQRDFLSLTSRSQQYIAPHSGHSVHLDQPELVVGYIVNSLHNARWYEARSNLVLGANAGKETPRLRLQYDVVLTGLVTPGFGHRP
jgi:pimeloyl-ACP methyl ester carboxylesterase